MQIVLLIKITKHINAENDGYSITFDENKIKIIKILKIKCIKGAAIASSTRLTDQILLRLSILIHLPHFHHKRIHTRMQSHPLLLINRHRIITVPIQRSIYYITESIILPKIVRAYQPIC